MVRNTLILALLLSLLAPTAVLAQSGSPVAGLAGQTAKLCGVTANFDLRVESTDWQKTLLGSDAPDGMWAVLVVTVTNTGDRPDIARGLLALKDNQGRIIEPYAGEEAVPFAVDLPPNYGAQATNIVQPGSSSKVVWVYEVPADVTSLELAPNTALCK